MESIDLFFQAKKCLADVRVEDLNRRCRELEKEIDESKLLLMDIYIVEFDFLASNEKLEKTVQSSLPNTNPHVLIHLQGKSLDIQNDGSLDEHCQTCYGSSRNMIVFHTEEQSRQFINCCLKNEIKPNEIYWRRDQSFGNRNLTIVYNQPVPFETMIQL